MNRNIMLSQIELELSYIYDDYLHKSELSQTDIRGFIEAKRALENIQNLRRSIASGLKDIDASVDINKKIQEIYDELHVPLNGFVEDGKALSKEEKVNFVNKELKDISIFKERNRTHEYVTKIKHNIDKQYVEYVDEKLVEEIFPEEVERAKLADEREKAKRQQVKALKKAHQNEENNRVSSRYSSLSENNKYSNKKNVTEDTSILDIENDEFSSKKGFFQKIKDKIQALKTRSDEIQKNRGSKRKMPWFVTIPVAGILTIAGVSGYSNKDVKSGVKNGNTQGISEEMKSGISKVEHGTVTYEIVGPNFEENSKDSADENLNVLQENFTEEQSIEDVIVNIGDRITVEDGLEYTGNCIGEGNVGHIGDVSWRPATEYYIDSVAFFHNGEFVGLNSSDSKNINEDLKKYADKCGVDVSEIDTKASISLVKGIHDTGWAEVSFEKMQKNKVVEEKDTSSKSTDNQKNIENEMDR